MTLEGKIAVVTGGSRGIGRAVAVAMAAAGADIVLGHLDDAEAGSALAEIRSLGRRAWAFSADLATEEGPSVFAEQALEAAGVPEILVNNAGGASPVPFETVDARSYDPLMSLNLRSAVLVTRGFYPAMSRRGHGRIINISSQLALRGETGMVLYAAAKAGLLGFTRALAREAAPHGILVNAIAPGPVGTDQTRSLPPDVLVALAGRLPLGRLGTVSEIAATAVLLAGPGGGFYCGACLSPNGGDVMH